MSFEDAVAEFPAWAMNERAPNVEYTPWHLVEHLRITQYDMLSYLRDGYRPDLLKRLKRGSFSVQDEIDLHQMTGEVARGAIVEFLAQAQRRGLQCVKLIHGKGLRSRPGGPVIKRLVDRLLRQRDDVVAFASARSEQGGTGAAVVLLKSKR